MLALALIPGIILFFAVWKFDTVEKESPILLLKLFVSGILVMIADIFIRTFGLRLMEQSYNGSSLLLYIFIDSFILTALIEEGGRFLALRLLTWKNREFNYTFDAIVYAVTVSVGFLLTENITYLIKYGSALNPVKLILPLLSQVFISVLMGYFYGRAKLYAGSGDAKNARLSTLESILVPIVLHGAGDMCIATGKTVFIVIYVIYALLLIAFSFFCLIGMKKNESEIEWTWADTDAEDPFEIDVTSLLSSRMKAAGKEDGNEGKM